MLCKMLQVAILLLLQFNSVPAQLATGGKYKIDIQRIVKCPEYNNIKLASPLEPEYVRYNRTTKVFNGNFTLSRDMDEKFSVQLIVQKWSDGAWKDNLVNVKFKDTCRTFLKYLKNAWVAFLKASGFRNPDRCPLKKGKYTIRNYMLPLDLIQQNFYYGSFNMKFIFTRESVVHTCAVIYLDITDTISF